MKKALYVCFFCFSIQTLSWGQQLFQREKRDYVWILGNSPINNIHADDNTLLKFNSSPLEIDSHNWDFRFNDTNASICDTSGNLLLITNGIELRNASNEVLATNMGPTFYSEDLVAGGLGYNIGQGALILALPESPLFYYVFHEDRDYGGTFNLYQTIVSIHDPSDSGELWAVNSPLIQDTLHTGRINAVRHANGRDWWILVFDEGFESYYSLLFDPAGVSSITKYPTGFGAYEFWDNSTLGQGVFSPDGDKYAYLSITTLGVGEDYIIHLYDFDRCTGMLSNPEVLVIEDIVFLSIGLAFSENGRFLYVMTWYNVYQYDLAAEDIAGSLKLIAEYDGFKDPIWGLSTFFNYAQLAPDGKIYIDCASSANYYHIIHEPNLPGQACRVEQHGLELPTLNYRAIPNQPYYGLGPLEGSPCDTLGIDYAPAQAAFSYYIEDSLLYQVAFFDGSLYAPTSWYWDFGDGHSSTERFPAHAYAAPGVYEVCLTAINGTGSSTLCREVSLLLTDINPIEAPTAPYRLYPNPGTGRFTLEYPVGIKGEVVMSNYLGQVVYQAAIKASSREQVIELPNAPAGVYALCIWADGHLRWQEKVVVLEIR